MSKRPSIQFYPGDWKKDPGVRACSLAARMLWFEVLLAMHEAEPRGYLRTPAGAAMDDKQIARIAGCSPSEVKRYMAELRDHGVFSVDDQGVIYSRRMVRDERLSAVRSASGSAGGNPVLLKQKDKQKVIQSVEDEYEIEKLKNIPKSEIRFPPGYALDEHYAEFRNAASSLDWIAADFIEGWHEWKVLDFEQRCSAIAGLKAQIATLLDPGMIPRPRKFLAKREWTRPVKARSASSGNTAAELAAL